MFKPITRAELIGLVVAVSLLGAALWIAVHP